MERAIIRYLLKNQVIFALFLIVIGWFMMQIRDILASIFISYIIMASLLPFVKFLRKRKVPNVLAVLIVYVSVTLVAVILIVPIIPFLTAQIRALAIGFPTYLSQTSQALGITLNTVQMQDYVARELNSIGANAIMVTKQVFGGLFSTLTVIIVSFYLLLNQQHFRKWVATFFEHDNREKVYAVLEEVDDKLGAWLRGQIFLCSVIGFLTLIALSIVGLPNALPLALLSGMLEAFPTLGPILSAVPAVIVAFTISPTLALTVAVIYTFIQFLENNLIVPKVMEHAVGLNPIIVILSVSVGATLMGFTGALLAIPFISFITVLVSSIRETDLLSTLHL